MLGRNLINFAKGNAAGIGAATLMVMARGYVKGNIAIRKMNPIKDPIDIFVNSIYFSEMKILESAIPEVIKNTYTKYGAPKSGAFWTQSVSDVFKKLLPNHKK